RVAQRGMSLLQGGFARQIVVAGDDERRYRQLAQFRYEVESHEIAVDVEVAAAAPHLSEDVPADRIAGLGPRRRSHRVVVRQLRLVGQLAIFLKLRAVWTYDPFRLE